MPQKQKRPSPLEDPPTASSDSEEQPPSAQQQRQRHPQSPPPPPPPQQEVEEETSSEETEDDDEEDDQEAQSPHTIKSAVKIPPPSPYPKSNSNSDSATESDSDSGSDSEPDAPAPPPNPKVKPIASKPMDQTSKPRAQSASARSASKRPADNNGHVLEPKRARKKATDGAGSDEENGDDGKKPSADSKVPFQRVFSEEDELAILKGIVEFTSKTGQDYLKQGDAFHDFLKKSLHVDASSNQLKQKIQRLRKKYNTAVKGRSGEPSFSKPHDQKAFELMKKIWGSDKMASNGAAEKPKSNGKGVKSAKESSARSAGSAKLKSKSETKSDQKSEPPLLTMGSKESEEDDDEVVDRGLALSSMIRFGKGLGGHSGIDENVVKKGMELIDASKKAELEGKWKKLQDAEMDLYMKRADLVAEQAKLIIQAYRSSKN